MNKPETLILYNSLAGSGNNPERSLQLGKRLNTDRIHDISDLESKKVNFSCERVLILGGDGTIHACISMFSQKDTQPMICIASGGTGNVLQKMLVKEGASISEEELLDADNWVHRARVYKPGVINVNNDYKFPMIVGAGFGEFETKGADALNSIRTYPLPKDMKIYLAGVLAFVSVVQRKHLPNTPLLQTYSIGERVGPFQVFSSEYLNIGNDKIGKVTVSDRNPVSAQRKLLLAMALWKIGIPVPRSVADVQYDYQFIQQTNGQVQTNVNIDGDSRSIKTDGNIVVFRDNRSYLAMALVGRK